MANVVTGKNNGVQVQKPGVGIHDGPIGPGVGPGGPEDFI